MRDLTAVATFLADRARCGTARRGGMRAHRTRARHPLLNSTGARRHHAPARYLTAHTHIAHATRTARLHGIAATATTYVPALARAHVLILRTEIHAHAAAARIRQAAANTAPAAGDQTDLGIIMGI